MFKNFLILKYVVSFSLPFIFLYSIYIQLNGDISPGGGFQGGIIFSTAVVGYDFIKNIKLTDSFLDAFIFLSISGFFIILTISTLPLILGANFMEYSVLAKNSHLGQHLGIFFFELGVGITVSSVISMLYFLIKSNK
ncbi:MAG: cation:proton antiporter [Rickettsia sp.]|nr:cation:proton antiporter [Rickettsia sp.]